MGYESTKKAARLSGNKTDRRVSPEAQRKSERNPLARTGLQRKR
jgi:hypothetical protein